MKKQLSLLLTLLLLLTLTACGEPEGVTITNRLGVDLITVSILDDDEAGTILSAGLIDGGTDFFVPDLDGGEGFLNITAEDTAGNTYRFPQVYFRDGIDITLCVSPSSGDIWAEYPYNDATQHYEGRSSIQDAARDSLYGVWRYSESGTLITFDGEGGYTWQTPEGTEHGDYTFDGEWIAFTPSSIYQIGWTRGSLSADGSVIYIEGDAGSYYTHEN